MKKFTSYGLVDPEIHYAIPRTELIDRTLRQVIGKTPEKGGHYITIWAPRQAGKSSVLHSVRRRVREESVYEWIDAIEINLQDLSSYDDANVVIQNIAARIFLELGIDKETPMPNHVGKFHECQCWSLWLS